MKRLVLLTPLVSTPTFANESTFNWSGLLKQQQKPRVYLSF